MLKKILLGSTLVMISSMSYADGFYLGAGLGGSGLFDDITTTDVSNAANNGQMDSGKFGFLGDVYAGYEMNLSDQFVLGGEAFLQGSSSNIRVTDVTGSATLKRRYGYGVRILPGYQFTPDTRGFLVLGYLHDNFKLTDDGLLDPNVNQNFGANAVQMGVGTMTALSNNLGLRADILYNDYQKKTVTVSATGDTYKNSLGSFDGVVSLLYRFG